MFVYNIEIRCLGVSIGKRQREDTGSSVISELKCYKRISYRSVGKDLKASKCQSKHFFLSLCLVRGTHAVLGIH